MKTVIRNYWSKSAVRVQKLRWRVIFCTSVNRWKPKA